LLPIGIKLTSRQSSVWNAEAMSRTSYVPDGLIALRNVLQ
jgi:hypothetical protein